MMTSAAEISIEPQTHRLARYCKPSTTRQQKPPHIQLTTFWRSASHASGTAESQIHLGIFPIQFGYSQPRCGDTARRSLHPPGATYAPIYPNVHCSSRPLNALLQNMCLDNALARSCRVIIDTATRPCLFDQRATAGDP
jgi:hypothetical protein